ncbi:MAG: hypothetical protein ACXW3C_18090 [Pyrinomonadaceae bacterium]
MAPDTNDSPANLAIAAVKVLLALALIATLVFAGWRIYQRLPTGTSDQTIAIDRSAKAPWRVVVRNRVPNATLHSPLELYQFDLVGTRREYEASPRLARQFDDFLARRMNNVKPLKAEVNGDGHAVAMLGAGDWWLHASASLDTGEKIEWRLPLAVTNRDQSIDLSSENAYERTKKF